jgi:hypothetical protein
MLVLVRILRVLYYWFGTISKNNLLNVSNAISWGVGNWKASGGV